MTDPSPENSSRVFRRRLDIELPVAVRGRGVRVWDDKGNCYLDASGGAIVVSIGHGDPAIVEAMTEQASSLAYVHGSQFTTAAVEAYAEALAPLLPLDDPRVYLVSGGSEAVETALKLARSFHLARGEPARTKVIARERSYHGNSLGALDASGRYSLRFPYEPWLGRVLRTTTPYEYRCERIEHEDCGRARAEELEQLILSEGPETVACFIAEPIGGAALGAAVPPPDYWPAVAEVCRRHGVLLIADEVMTGCGRTGAWFACDHWHVRPDILVAGKGTSSGYWPLGFAACSGEVFDAVAPRGFVNGFTFSHSAVGAAVGLAVLERLRDGGLVETSRIRGGQLLERLREALGELPTVGDIRGKGLLVGIELVRDRESKAPFPRELRAVQRVADAAKRQGLLVYSGTGMADGRDGDAIMLGPPFVISEEELSEVAEKLALAIGEALPAGLEADAPVSTAS
ncbi:MAG: aminotransferase family protein [Gaiellaceae bacterium]